MHCARTFDQGNTNCSTRIRCTCLQGKLWSSSKFQKLTPKFTHGCRRSACLGILSFWDSGSTAKNLRRPSSFNPKYSGDELTSNQPTISETVPLTPPFARRLENKLMALGTSTQKKKADNTSMSKLSVENTMLKEKLKEQKKLVISLQKHKRKLEHQVEAF